MAESKKPSLFGKFFKGIRGEKVTSKDLQEQEATVRRDPNNLRALHKLGDLYAKAEQPEKAIEIYIRAAESYIERAFYQKAVAVYKQVLKMKPSLLDVQKRLAEVYIELGRRSDALAQYQNLARKYESTGNLTLATEMLLEMLALDSENVPLRVKLAELYLAMSESNSAIGEFEKALNSLAAKENWDDYIKVGERLLFAAPEHLGALKTIARVYLDTGEVMKAIGKLQKAFQLERRDPETLEVLAVAFDRLEQPEKTISVLKELVDIYKELGRTDYVRDVYQQILERDPNDVEVQRAFAALPATESSVQLPAASEPPSVPEPPPIAPLQTSIPDAPSTPPPSAPDLSLSEEELERLLNEADVYIKYGLVPRVEEALNRIFAAYPEHLEARRLKVELLKMQERSEEAANELLTLAKVSQEPDEALSYLEQVLELEDVPPVLQEEAYQMTIRLRPSGHSASGHFASVSEPAEELSIEASDSFVVEVEDIEPIELNAEEDLTTAPGAEDIEIVSLDDIVAVDSLSGEFEADFISQDEIVIEHFSQQELPASPAPVALRYSTDVEDSADVTFMQSVEEIEELELLDEADELTQPPTARDEMFVAMQTDSVAPSSNSESPLHFGVQEPAAPAPTPTPAPSLFAPPSPPKEEDDAFDQFLFRAKQDDDPIEEEEDNFSNFDDFLKGPVLLEPSEVPKPAQPTRSSVTEELSDMEAAAARLQALIQAKEAAEAAEAEAEAQAAEEAAHAAAEKETQLRDIPAPFAVAAPPTPTDIPAPFAVAEPQEEHISFDNMDAVIDDADSVDSIEVVEEVLSFEPSSESEDVLDIDSAVEIEDAPLTSEEAFFADTTETVPTEEGELFSSLDEDELDFEDFGDFDELDGAFSDIQEDPTPTPEFTLDPSDPHIEELEEAAFYLDQDEPQYAIELFDRILQQTPDHEIARAGIQLAIELEQQLSSKQEEGFLYNLDTALGEITTTQRERDRVEGELRAFKEEAQKQFGEDGETLYELGVAYFGMGLYEMAAETFQNCITNAHREFDCYKMIGSCYTAQGLREQALSNYQSALQLPNITTGERLDVLFEMGAVYESTGNASDALTYYEEVSMLDENYRNVQSRIQALRAS